MCVVYNLAMSLFHCSSVVNNRLVPFVPFVITFLSSKQSTDSFHDYGFVEICVE